MRQSAGDPEAVAEALDRVDDLLAGDEPSRGLSLNDPARDAAWASMGG